MANIIKKRYKLKLNSLEKIEELLQELYNECDKNITDIQEQMNKLSKSVELNTEIVDAKTKYAKAMNDFITNKDKAIGRKLEIAKLMTEIHKYNGNVSLAMANDASSMDWDSFKDALIDNSDNEEKPKEEYKLSSANEVINGKC